MGILKGKIEDYSSPLAGVPARVFTGYFFLKYGLQKATSGFGGEALRQTLGKWAAETPYHFYLPFLQKFAIPYAGAFAMVVIFGEIAVGAALLAGCATRFAAIAGIFMCLNFLFASGTPLLSVEQPVIFTVLLVTVYATAAGRSLGLDAFLKGKLPPFVA
jgi:thiosulfate dehydrogenase [quinone] large subunit